MRQSADARLMSFLKEEALDRLSSRAPTPTKGAAAGVFW